MSEQNRSRSNQGYLYPNKRTSDKQPDYRGKLNVNGSDFLVSGWIREKDGEKMISLALTDPATLPAQGGGNRGGGQPSGGNGGNSNRGNEGDSGLPDIFDGLPG